MKRFTFANRLTNRSAIGRVAASLAIAVGFVLVFLGVNASVTGSDAQKLPSELESIQPVRNATQVLSQERVQVDLAEGYTGELTVNGVEIETFNLADIESEPGASVSLPKATIFEPGNDTLTFIPSEGAGIEAFTTGINTVRVVYWKVIDGRAFSKSFTWQFDVI